MPLDDKESLELARKAKFVAVLGMTDGSKPGRASYDIPVRLERAGMKLVPVNPMIETALGHKSLKSLAELPEGVEILDVFRRSEAIPEIADEILALPPAQRPQAVWLQTGITHPESEAKLEAAGMKVVSDRCLGVYAARAGR
jgi:predicted CoA-binding protein